MTGYSKNPVSVLYHLFWCAVDWLYPPVCGGCEQWGNRWCTICQSNSQEVGKEICLRCGDVLKHGEECSNCLAHPPSYQALRSWGMHQGPLRLAIHSLKYQRNIGLAEALSIHLIDLLDHLKWTVDLIVPVPLAAQRRLERGYNQASLLAFPLALARRLPYSNRALHRVRETRSQVGLTSEERHSNVKDAFIAVGAIVKGKSVLVIDDVATTGATQEACARALLSAGASTVYGITLARAGFHTESAGEPPSSDHLIL